MFDRIIVGKMCFPRFSTCFPIEMVILGYMPPLFGQLHMCVCLIRMGIQPSHQDFDWREQLVGQQLIVDIRHSLWLSSLGPGMKPTFFMFQQAPFRVYQPQPRSRNWSWTNSRKNRRRCEPTLKMWLRNWKMRFSSKRIFVGHSLGFPRNANLTAAIPRLCGPTLQLCWGKTMPVPPFQMIWCFLTYLGLFESGWACEIPWDTQKYKKYIQKTRFSSMIFWDVHGCSMIFSIKRQTYFLFDSKIF